MNNFGYPQQYNPYMQQQPNQNNDWMQAWRNEVNARMSPQYQQYGQQLPPPQTPYSILPYTGDEDLKAYPVGFEGHQHFFVDKPNQKIRVKYWDRDAGKLVYNTYALELLTTPQNEPVAASNQNSSPAWANDIERLEAKIIELEGKLNDESNVDADAKRNGAEKPATRKSNAKPTEQPKPDGDA